VDVEGKIRVLHYDLCEMYRMNRKTDKPLIKRYWAEIDKLEDLLKKMRKESAETSGK
jgi:hypothetical protein